MYAYACFYQSQTDSVEAIEPTELTITFVCNHYPRRMLTHIRHVRGITARLREPGIYDLTGDPIAMQLIVTKRLSKENNFWLQSLRNDLRTGEEIRTIEEKYRKNRDKMPYRAVMDVIMRANSKRMEEKMIPYEAWEEAVLQVGEEKGESRMCQLAEKLITASRLPDFLRAIKDRDFRRKMYEEFEIGKNE